MRTTGSCLLLVLCAALASGAPNLLAEFARLAGGHHHHHDHGGHGAHHGARSAPLAALADFDFGAGINLFLKNVQPGQHYNPFLPNYQPPPHLASVSGPGRQPQPQQQQGPGFIDASLGPQQQQQQGPGFIDASLGPQQQQQGPGFIDASLGPHQQQGPGFIDGGQQLGLTELNVNPGSGNSGPKGPLVSSCASGLVCVPEQSCDPYTGFVVGTLDRPAADPRLPTVALQRCQGGSGDGVCCRDTVGAFQPGPGPDPVPMPVAPPVPVPVQPPAAGGNPSGTKTDSGGGGGSNQFAGNPFLSGGGFGGGGNGGGSGGGNSGGAGGDGGGTGGGGGGSGGTGGTGGDGGDGGGGGGGGGGDNFGLGELVACDQDQRCVNDTLCGDDGFVSTDGSGVTSASRPTNTFCFTPLGFAGTCCRDRPGSGVTRQQTQIQCTDRQSCVEPPQCDEDGFIVTDGSGLLDIRNNFLTTFCRLSSGGKGRCCEPRPSTSREVTCQTSQECVRPDLCDENGLIVTDGAGLINARFNTREYCLVSSGQKGTCCRRSESVTQSPSTSREVVCQPSQECVRPDLCDENGRIVTDGAGLINARFNTREFCRLPSGGKGRCCEPSTSTSREVTCQTSQECVRPDLCDENGLIVTDGAGLINARFNTREYCLLSSGGKGRCCQSSPAPQPPQQVVCDTTSEDCVSPGLCGDDGYIITDGSGIIDPRITSRTYCLASSGQKGTCCRRPEQVTQSPSTSREVVCQPSQECVRPDLCDENGRIVTDGAGLINARFNTREFCRLLGGEKGRCCLPPETASKPSTCGQSLNIRILGLDPGSTEASFGELPWQAIISFTNFTFVCGGSLVSRQHVVTAAHCVANLRASEIQVRLGEYQVNAEDEPLPYRDRTVAEINIHPDYKSGPLFNDLAVLRLSSPIELDSHIQPICLPSAGQQFTGRCVSSGWGKDAFQDGQFSTILKKVRLPMVSHDQCQQNLRNTRLGHFFRLNPSFVCAGGEEGIDACKGDGGGPLACVVDHRYTLAGVTSWGIGCGQRDVPGVYASAEAGLDFLRQHTGL